MSQVQLAYAPLLWNNQLLHCINCTPAELWLSLAFVYLLWNMARFSSENIDPEIKILRRENLLIESESDELA